MNAPRPPKVEQATPGLRVIEDPPLSSSRTTLAAGLGQHLFSIFRAELLAHAAAPRRNKEAKGE